MAFRQCSRTLVLFTSVASGLFLEKTDNKMAPVLSSDITRDIKHMLFETHASVMGSASDEFTQGCLTVTKAVVAQNDGKKKGVASQLFLVCSGLQLPLDVDICERYRDTLLEHLHKDSVWNLMGMDYPLFCTGMDKVVAEHKSEMQAMATSPKYVDTCFKVDATYGFKKDGSCDNAETLLMLGPAIAVDAATNHFGVAETVAQAIPSAEECQAECKKHEDCKFWDYVTKDAPEDVKELGESCWLLSAVSCTPGYGMEAGAKGTITGPRDCPGAEEVAAAAVAQASPAPAAPSGLA